MDGSSSLLTCRKAGTGVLWIDLGWAMVGLIYTLSFPKLTPFIFVHAGNPQP
ncbi:hypothetical protein F383_38242 [Gossypium arboreum]|uniref:Uncharacterized protein n=1 Tax=Gossypium arboreum TaxID=29729 RepID=A0A0B0MFI0_GOSAR|nr:hypothetical protein F383_38242 [Gossypium arboreum]